MDKIYNVKVTKLVCCSSCTITQWVLNDMLMTWKMEVQEM